MLPLRASWAAAITVAAALGCGGKVSADAGGASGGAGAGSTIIYGGGGSGGSPALSTMAACVPGAPPVLVAPFPPYDDNAAPLNALLVDATSVYWLSGAGAVYRVSKAGGTSSALPGLTGVPRNGLAVDADGLYACQQQQAEGAWDLVRTALDGSGPVTLASGFLGCQGVGVFGGDVLWADLDGISRADKTTGAGASLIASSAATSGGSIWQFSTGAGGAFWIETLPSHLNALLTVANGGGPLVTLAPSATGVFLAVGGGGAFWSTSFPDATAGTYLSASPGATPVRLGVPYPLLAADADAAYSALTIGVVKLPAATGAPVVLADDTEVDDGTMAVDESCVYFLNAALAAVLKTSKVAP